MQWMGPTCGMLLLGTIDTDDNDNATTAAADAIEEC